jgi:hypothetical protein
MPIGILAMKKSVIASIVISSIAWLGLGGISNSIAQGSPGNDPGASQSPLPGSGAAGTGQSAPGDPVQSIPTTTPEASSSPDVLKKPTTKKSNLRKSSKTKKKKLSTLGNPRLP